MGKIKGWKKDDFGVYRNPDAQGDQLEAIYVGNRFDFRLANGKVVPRYRVWGVPSGRDEKYVLGNFPSETEAKDFAIGYMRRNPNG